MTLLLNKAKAMKSLPYIEDKSLYRAVDLALWLYLDNEWSLSRAVKKAADKYDVKPKKSIEKLLRQAIPQELIAARSQSNVISHQKLKRMQVEGEIHVDDIIKTKP